jgi:hypothetical protein
LTPSSDGITRDPIEGALVAKTFPGNGIFRGVIHKYKDDDAYEDEDPSGTWHMRFTNGIRKKMCSTRAREAMELWETEIEKLMACGVPKRAAWNLEDSIPSEHMVNPVGKPVLSCEEDENGDMDSMDRRYEVSFRGEMPCCIVGLELPPEPRHAGEYIPISQKLVIGLTEKLLQQGVESARQVYQLEKIESHKRSRLT